MSSLETSSYVCMVYNFLSCSILLQEDHIHSTTDINSHTGVDKDTPQSNVDLHCDEQNGKVPI